MNKEQQELVDEAYINYGFTCIGETKRQEQEMKEKGGWLTLCLTPYFEDKEKFINKIKTDTEFSDTWGLQIEERELTTSEIWSYIHNNKIEIKHQHAVLSGHPIGSELRKQFIPELKENYNITTKLITITYNDKTIESYEN